MFLILVSYNIKYKKQEGNNVNLQGSSLTSLLFILYFFSAKCFQQFPFSTLPPHTFLPRNTFLVLDLLLSKDYKRT